MHALVEPGWQHSLEQRTLKVEDKVGRRDLWGSIGSTTWPLGGGGDSDLMAKKKFVSRASYLVVSLHVKGEKRT